MGGTNPFSNPYTSSSKKRHQQKVLADFMKPLDYHGFSEADGHLTYSKAAYIVRDPQVPEYYLPYLNRKSKQFADILWMALNKKKVPPSYLV